MSPKNDITERQDKAQNQAKTWNASVLTLFPDAYPGVLGVSVIGSAQKNHIWGLDVVDIRDFSANKHRSVDDTPSGGGPGMVLRPDVADKAIESVALEGRPLIYLTPRGTPLTQKRVRELSTGPGVVIFCGRFEGLDERVIQSRNMEEVCIGDFVLAGGDVAAQCLLEACIRLLPGTLGAADSTTDESFEDGLLEYPLYTKPREFAGMQIPAVLTSGDHKKVAEWRHQQQIEITRTRRPDLYEVYLRNKGDGK